MHFVTGGAYNGKRSWVRKQYNTSICENLWISAYEGKYYPDQLNKYVGSLVILEGIEQWLKDISANEPADKCREVWGNLLNSWMEWEQEKETRNVLLIGTDLSKGIVPMERENRKWRDITGWCYQDTVQIADRVDLIWYGINQQIK